MSEERDRRRWGRAFRRVGTGLGLASVAGYLAISIMSANILTRSGTADAANAAAFALPEAARPWSVTTEDGLTLRGGWLPDPSSDRLLILVHGMRESSEHLADLAVDLHRRGFNVLFFDLRGHGRSDPHRLTMGRRERADLLAALKWARGEGFTPDRIGWLGRSMGGAMLVMEGADNPEIGVVVLDSPYGNLPVLLDDQLTRHSHLPKVFNPGIILAAHQVYGVRTDDLMPIESARQWGDRPMLLIHGDQDAIVPIEQARSLAQAAGPSCELRILRGVGHVRAYRQDPSGYADQVAAFFRSHLGR
ncbi:MAG: alpha/beta fold hydrolase [Isosphaeraceae bacterium]